MSQGLRSNRVAAGSAMVVLVFAWLFPGAAAGADSPAAPVKSASPLSPLLTELARPAVAAKAPAAQAADLGVPRSGPASLMREGERVLVTARFDGGLLASLPRLREAGARLVSVSGRQQTATLAVAPAELPGLAAVPGVRGVWQLRQPIAYGVGEGPCEGGSVISEGLGQLHVDAAREAFELRGRGLTIGVLSDSYDAGSEAAQGGPIATHAAEDVASNDLPGTASSCSEQQFPVDVLAEGGAEGEDEGRAMLQILHDLAPHAKLAFATAFQSEESFAENIERLARPVSEGGAGAEVIVDDVSWFEEPFFQDGPVAAAIDKVTSEGVTYLTAAGNDNLFDSGGNEIGSWEAPAFRDTGTCPAVVAALAGANGKHCMDFEPGGETDTTFGITVEPGETLILDLQWAEPWNGVATDLDAYLLSQNGSTILDRSTERNITATQRPVEVIDWTNASSSPRTVQLAINRFAGVALPRLKFVLLENGGGVSAVEYPTSSGGDVVGPTIYGHAGAASALAVAAVPFSNSAKIEPYSSRGPVTHYYGPVQGTVPALPLGSPEEIPKPDFAATDCGATTFFAFLTGGHWRFCGTSAAAPHAAAVAALVRQAKPDLSEQQLRDALSEAASPVGAFPPEAAGVGLLDAYAAIGSLPGPIAGGDGPSEDVAPVAVSPVSGHPQAAATTPAPVPPPTPVVAPPNTSITGHPGRVVRTRGRTARVGFRFGSDQAGVTYLCKVDKGAFRACPGRLRRRFRLGRHVVEVKAVSSAGLADPTPAVFRFRVRRIS